MGWPKGVPRKSPSVEENIEYPKNLRISIKNPKEGFIHVSSTDTIHDESVIEISCDNILQFVDDVIKEINEYHRILQNNGTLTIIVPVYPHKMAFQDPKSKNVFTDLTFHYFFEQSPFSQIYGKEYGISLFKALNQSVNGPYLTVVLRK